MDHKCLCILPLKARLHRRFLFRRLDAIFVALNEIARVNQVRFSARFVAAISQRFRTCLKLDATLARQLHRVTATKIACVNGPLSGLHTANFRWQARVGKLQKVGKLVANKKHGNFQHGRFLVQFQSRTTVKQRIRREEPESGGELEKSGRNQVCPRAPPFCFVCF